jgi:hypothetical protein
MINLVDEEAYKIAYNKFKHLIATDTDFCEELVQAYEAAKLDKAVVKKSFTTDKPLPALPEKKPESYTSTNGNTITTIWHQANQEDVNQLISCLAAVYEEIRKDSHDKR